MAIPKKLPETSQEILGYWIIQILEFHARLQRRPKHISDGDWAEMRSLDDSLKTASENAGINLETRNFFCRDPE
jgi:hypothetical protein